MGNGLGVLCLGGLPATTFRVNIMVVTGPCAKMASDVIIFGFGVGGRFGDQLDSVASMVSCGAEDRAQAAGGREYDIIITVVWIILVSYHIFLGRRVG